MKTENVTSWMNTYNLQQLNDDKVHSSIRPSITESSFGPFLNSNLCHNNEHLNIYFSRLIPQVAENAAARALSEAKPLAWRRPT